MDYLDRRLEKISRFVDEQFGQQLPNKPWSNYLCGVRHFIWGNERRPKHLSDADANLNDFFFWRFIRNEWTELERRCVDKEFAKGIACDLSKGAVKAANAKAVIPVAGIPSVEHLREALKPYIGQPLIAKPTHSSGAALFLNQSVDDNQLKFLLRSLQSDFFYNCRESQYFGLEKKLIIEELIGGRDELDDFKFFCVSGQPILCQVDIGRHSSHQRNLYSIPRFDLLDCTLNRHPNCRAFVLPDRRALAEMVSIAARISLPFDFVRIDLYTANREIYFGEFTFSPGAAVQTFSDEKISRTIFDQIKTKLSWPEICYPQAAESPSIVEERRNLRVRR